VSIYIAQRELPAVSQPAVLARREGITLIVVDPRADRAEFFDWCWQVLNKEEIRAYRIAFGLDPDTRDLPAHLFDHYYVPECLHTPKERARQAERLWAAG
jgi:hypothetical protein